MSGGLFGLLDDVAALAKLAAASVDDIGAAAGRATVKAAGVVVDDTAVTPQYVQGIAAERELPIVKKIAVGSLRNKLLYLLPAALALSFLAPWAITPLLMLGGAYLCFEGAEKIVEALGLHRHDAHGEAEEGAALTAAEFEDAKVQGAIRTDFVLSSEIMAITLANIPHEGIVTQAAMLAVVGVGITVAVYGAVALIVKADDAGVFLARSRMAALRALGRGLVLGMPPFLKLLSLVGTAAMLWVGGGILLHGLEAYGVAGPAHLLHEVAEAAGGMVPVVSGAVAWLVAAGVSAVIGLVLGGVLIPVAGAAVAVAGRVRR